MAIHTRNLEVVMFTHNHESFVDQALGSVLAQITDFEVSIRIHDDASTDRTVPAVERILKNSRIPWHLERAPENRFASGTLFYHEFIAKSSAQYVAVLDGDDFWIDDTKLQAQVDLLDRLPNAALCHHPIKEFSTGQTREVDWPPEEYRVESIPGDRLSERNFISSSSVLLRRSMFPDLMPHGYNELGIGDYPMWALAAAEREIAFIDRPMTAYRVHDTNIYASIGLPLRFRRELGARLYVRDNVPEHLKGIWREGILQAVDHYTNEVQHLSAELATAEEAMAGMLGSTSWRLTAPLRATASQLRRRSAPRPRPGV